jgi:hypothetical protein
LEDDAMENDPFFDDEDGGCGMPALALVCLVLFLGICALLVL